MTSAVLRPAAEGDLLERTRHDRGAAGDDVARRIFDAAIETLRDIERWPRSASRRLGELCGVPGLRFRRVPGFPCGWCYFLVGDRVDVVRLLGDAQDLDSILEGAEPEAE